ncbi:MAG: sigma-70 family RNA polymerase sigma factor [Bacilli bacterium]|nr:sigma-70 family RNA polymerase sigma factor [Clostridium sp.]MDY6015366.1 sigma-70 family RNA polymerase sigma factor [Bacilli bacterium]
MRYKGVNDYELLYLVGENNEEVYNSIYAKYKPLIHRMAKTLCENYKSALVEYDDLFQEGMYGLNNAIKSFNGKSGSLFYTLAKLCISREMNGYVAKMLRGKNMILSSAVSFDTPISKNGFVVEDTLYSHDDSVELQFESIEMEKYILDLKYELKDEYMPVYELKLNGFSNAAIATLLDLRYKDVDNYLRSIKKTLRRKIINLID